MLKFVAALLLVAAVCSAQKSGGTYLTSSGATYLTSSGGTYLPSGAILNPAPIQYAANYVQRPYVFLNRPVVDVAKGYPSSYVNVQAPSSYVNVQGPTVQYIRGDASTVQLVRPGTVQVEGTKSIY